jgi:hypothetical protein
MSRLPLSAERPEPLFASLSWFERALLAAAGLWVLVATPYTLYSLYLLR